MATDEEGKGWTDRRKALLKEYWEKDGLTGPEIVKKFDGLFTRGAVVSAVTRFGLKRATPTLPKADAAQQNGLSFLEARSKRGADSARPPKPRPKELPVPDLPGTVSVEKMEPGMCKWPVGDPLAEGFLFCGRKTGGRMDPYCSEHKGPSVQQESTSGSQLIRSLRRYI